MVSLRAVAPGLVAATLALPAGAQEGAPSVRYALTYAAAGAPTVSVRVAWSADAIGPRTLVVPRAIPMGYANVPYDRWVDSVRAYDADGAMLSVARGEGPRWTLGGGDSRVGAVEYRVDVARMETEVTGASDASKARPGYLGLLGYSVFAYVEGLEQAPLELRVRGPPGWPLFLTLAPRVPAPREEATARAARFYDLADSQVIMGPDLQLRRAEGTVPVYTAVYAEAPVDVEVVEELALEAMERVVAYFAGAPLRHYTVHQEYLLPRSPDHVYGFSMEHMESGTFFLGTDRAVTSRTPAGERARTLFNFLHHFAHSWVPKRSYGPGYFPFQWELAPLIETIWLSEGFVRYASIEMFADALPAAEGEAYRRRVLDGFRADLAGMPAFLNRMTLPELSRTGSTAYSDDFRVGRSLFMRGALMAEALDARIRAESRGTRRFRDVMRHLVAWTARHGRAYTTAELPGLFREATGVDVRSEVEAWMGTRIR